MAQAQLTKLMDAVEIFRDVYSEIPPQTCLMFMQVCQEEGCSIKDLQERFEMSQASASRNARLLSERVHSGRQGLGLVELRIDEQDYRIKRAFLTEKGREVRDRLTAVV
ncbi:MarR family transcriptional regulator [Ferrimonas sediminicola]|uniref:MarR family transcriptional regulator n=1 Tax=Ferrimonas sediminicola TaxID=2569538 RepID=A0A4V5NVC5_9GAMM|nr:MarR family transcriptional regulator [Ferrimonas sediminicola]TKB49949.1 MarR family transcriptional regulator [Ferrimonas sediminicola]